jgi:hypothetical protein
VRFVQRQEWRQDVPFLEENDQGKQNGPHETEKKQKRHDKVFERSSVNGVTVAKVSRVF